MFSLKSTVLLGAFFVAIPALALPADPSQGAPPSSTTLAVTIPTAPGVLLGVNGWAKIGSYRTADGWGGMGFDDWFFKFDATYTSEAFGVTLWAEPTGLYSNNDWTTAAPTATLSCNVHVTASPTEQLFVEITGVTPYVPSPTVNGATLTCVPTSTK